MSKWRLEFRRRGLPRTNSYCVNFEAHPPDISDGKAELPQAVGLIRAVEPVQVALSIFTMLKGGRLPFCESSKRPLGGSGNRKDFKDELEAIQSFVPVGGNCGLRHGDV